MLTKSDRLKEMIESGMDYRTRTIYLHGEIDREGFSHFSANLKLLNENKGPICVEIFSEGGEYAAGFAVFDAISLSSNPIDTVGTGEVSSIAAVVFQAGKKRILTPEARLMIHNVYVVMPDEKFTSHDLKRYSNEISILSSRYHQVLADRSGLSINKIRSWCEKEKYMSAKEAVKFGLADEIKARK